MTAMLEEAPTTSGGDFLSLIESYDQAEASAQKIYAGDGRSIASGRKRLQESPRYDEKFDRALDLYHRVLNGNRWATLQFQEAMSTSDFAVIFGDVLDRQVYAAYQHQTVQWNQFVKRGTVRDFRTVDRKVIDGGEALYDEVKELSEYPEAAVTPSKYSYKVRKFGRTFGLSWESLINDDLDMFRDLPVRLGNGARRKEEHFATSLFASASGPNSTFFAAGNNNIVTGNPVLSITALQTAFTVLSSQKDADGGPIYVGRMVLVVPPALQVPARNILNATQIVTAAGSGGASSEAGRADRLETVNWMRDMVDLVVDPWLPVITTSGTVGNTAWYLIAAPSPGIRPAAEMGFLLGHESPEIFQKASNMVRVGGGVASPEDGDFETDAAFWKGRHVLGGTLMDPKMAVASAGQ